MKKEELLVYEAPTITEFISWSWGQNLAARYLDWKINRKWERYQFRLNRERYFKELLGEVNKD